MLIIVYGIICIMTLMRLQKMNAKDIIVKYFENIQSEQQLGKATEQKNSH